MSDKLTIFSLAGLLVGLLGLAMVLAFCVSIDVSKTVIKEGGAIETISAVLYMVALVLFVLTFGLKAARRYWYILAALAGLSLREMDAHKALTTMSVFKSRFYSSGDVPMIEKLVGLGIIILLLYIFYLVVSRHLKGFVEGLRRFDPLSIAVFLALASMGIAKTFDGIGRKLADFGIILPPEDVYVFYVLEEVLELGIGLYFICAIIIYVSRPV
ncbi:MAG: hypothetical protein GY927_14600 [bacterium]|nr:hypothetical protein [bacterium]